MCQLSNLSPAELNILTKAQLITLVLADRPPTPDPSVDTLDAKGQLLKRETTYRDIAGKATHTEVVEQSFYPTGEIDTITVYRKDAAGKPEATAKQIKHSRCLKGYEPPTLSVVATPVEGPPPD